MLTPQAIEDFKDFLENIIAYAMVTVNGVTTKVLIHRKERLKDGRIAAYINITPPEGKAAIVQRVQLYNKNKKLWADKAEKIELSDVQEGALYRFIFKFEEQEV